jgi:PAS domain S-box-containing protein
MTEDTSLKNRVLSSLELLVAISRELAAQLDVHELLTRILQLTIESIGAASGSILVLDESGEVIEGAVAYEGEVREDSADKLVDTFEHGLAGWVFENRKTAYVPNTAEDKRWLKRSGEEFSEAPKSAICVPLMAGERVVGVLTLVHPDPDHFSEDDLTLIQAIADQAGIAVENARLFQAEQEGRAFASTLQEIARIVNSALEPSLVFPQVLDQLERVVHYDSASIFMLQQGILRLEAARGFDDEEGIIGETIPPNPDLLVYRVLHSQKSLVIDDVQKEQGWLNVGSLPESNRIRGWIGAPLVLRDRAVGVLCVDSQTQSTYGEEEAQKVTVFADQTATAVANAQLFSESQRQLQATRSLAETARAVSATLNLDEVLMRILSETMRTLEGEAASLALVDPITGELEFRVASGKGAERIVGLRLKKGEGIAGWVAEQGDPILVPDVKADPRFYPEIDEKIGFETRMIAAAPIKVQSKTIGVLEAINPRRGEFTSLQTELLLGIAGLAGTAIAHAQLFSETQEARLRYAGLFEDSIDPILISDLQGYVTDANHRAESFLGFNRDELLGVSTLDLHEPDSNRLPRDLSQLEMGQTVSYETKASHKLGDELPIEVYIKRIDIEGKPFLQWILRDISERLELDELRSDLTSMIFHDLRSPLGNVLSSLEVLKSSLPTDDEAIQSILSISLRSGRRLQRLVEMLLDHGQLESGQAVLHKTHASVGTLIAESVEEVHPIAEAKGHVLGFELPSADLPEVEMDVDMIRRVIINLLENAIKYTRQSGRISVSAHRDDHHLVVKVQDNGPGISKRDQVHIFDKFARIQHGGRPKGLGLGLAFCRLAIEEHKGKIWVESEVGKGSTFSFTLPLA